MVLRVPPGGHVEDDAPFAFLIPAGVQILNAELRLADPGGAQDDGHGSREQTPSEHLIQSRYPGGMSSHEFLSYP